MQPEHLEGAQDLVTAPGNEAWSVEVLDSHEPAAAVMAGVEEAAEGGD